MATPAPAAVTVNVPLDAPAWIMTGVCTVATTVLLLTSDTAAPSAGAAPMRVTVPVTESPLTAPDAPSETDESTGSPGVTVSVGDWRLVPVGGAVIMAPPGPTAATAKVALEEPP